MNKLLTTLTALSILLIATAAYAETYTVERVKGTVLDIDVTPMFVDGPGLLRIRTDEAKKINIYVSACEGLCSREAVNVLNQIKVGDRIIVNGQARDDGSISVYKENHSLQIIQNDAEKKIGAYVVERVIDGDALEDAAFNTSDEGLVEVPSSVEGGGTMVDLQGRFRNAAFAKVGKEAYTQTYTVERVIDGDTIKLSNGEEVQLIGVNAPNDVFPEGADRTLMDPTTESVNEADDWGVDLDTLDKMGQEATEFVKFRIMFLSVKKTILLEYDVEKRDKYGRILAYVFVKDMIGPMQGKIPDGYIYDDLEKPVGKRYLFLNATIISAGYATPMTIPPNVKYANLFQRLYKEARDEQRGLWKDLERIEGVDDIRPGSSTWSGF